MTRLSNLLTENISFEIDRESQNSSGMSNYIAFRKYLEFSVVMFKELEKKRIIRKVYEDLLMFKKKSIFTIGYKESNKRFLIN